MQKQMVLEDK